MKPEPGLIRASVVFYILHILLHHKVALCELMAFGSIFTLCWALARGEARFSFHILYYPLALYGLVSSITSFAATRHLHEIGEGTLWFKMMIFPAALILYRRLPGLKERIVVAFAVLTGGSAVWALIQFIFFDRRTLETRISGPSSHVMTFSGLLLPLTLMFLILWIHQRRPLYLAVTIVSTVTLLLTFTRSAWLGWSTAVLVILMLQRSRVRWLVPGALLLFLTFLPLPLFSRVMSTFDMKQESNFDRLRMLDAGVEMIKDRPLLGIGPANVKEIYSLYKKHDAPRHRPPHLHNNVVQLWAERGILGLAAYLLWIALCVRECIRAWRGQQRMWAEIGLAAIVSLTVAGLFEFNFGDTEVFYLMLNMMALVVAWTERSEPDSGPQPNEAEPSLVPALA